MTEPARPPPPHGERDPPVWRLLDLGRCDPYIAQTFAESVAVSVAQGASQNTLLLARPNTPYISLGFHQSFEEEIDELFLRSRPVPVIRRVTGGGTTWLDSDQLFYQLVYREDPSAGVLGGPPDLARFLRGPVRCLRDLGVPAEVRPPSDLVVAGRKISGNAGGESEGVHLLVGGFLGRVDTEAMAGMLRCPHSEFRDLFRREIGRWLTSLERELPSPLPLEAVGGPLLRAFEREGLFRVRADAPSRDELGRFEREVRPRHHDPGWVRQPLVLGRPDGVVRRVRVAGSRFVVAAQSPNEGELLVGVVEEGRVEESFGVQIGAAAYGDPRRPLARDDPRRELLLHAAP